MLFYTGKRSPYPYSTRWLDEFDAPVLAGKLYSSAFPLVDVTVIPDDEIAGHRSMAALTLLQKHIHQRDLAELVDRLAPILLAGYLSSSQVISLVHYIVQAGETSDAEAFVRELAQRVPQHGDALMTIDLFVITMSSIVILIHLLSIDFPGLSTLMAAKNEQVVFCVYRVNSD